LLHSFLSFIIDLVFKSTESKTENNAFYLAEYHKYSSTAQSIYSDYFGKIALEFSIIDKKIHCRCGQRGKAKFPIEY